MLKADIEENGGNSSYDLDAQDASVYALPPHHYSNNEFRLHNGQHVALGKRWSNTFPVDICQYNRHAIYEIAADRAEDAMRISESIKNLVEYITHTVTCIYK